jgi:hypothetical protein
MASKNVGFAAIKTVKNPTTGKFKTKSGETVSFKALRTARQKQVVHSRAKRK